MITLTYHPQQWRALLTQLLDLVHGGVLEIAGVVRIVVIREPGEPGGEHRAVAP